MGICVKCDRCNTTFNGNYLESLAGASTGGAEGDDAVLLMVGQARALGWIGGLSGQVSDDLCPKCSKQLSGQLNLKFKKNTDRTYEADKVRQGVFCILELNAGFIPMRNLRHLSEPVATLLEAKALCEAVYERLKNKGD